MTIQRTRKLRLHKRLVIQCLQSHPEDLSKVAPTWEGTAEEFIQALIDDPREWIIDGELAETPAE